MEYVGDGFCDIIVFNEGVAFACVFFAVSADISCLVMFYYSGNFLWLITVFFFGGGDIIISFTLLFKQLADLQVLLTFYT